MMSEPTRRPDAAPASIRVYRHPQDYQFVYDLWSRAGDGIHLRRSDEPEEIQKKISRDPDLFLLAERDGKLVGAVLGGFDGRRGMMYHLAVEPSERSQGIGQALVDELERHLREKGCIRYYLLVAKDNHEAISFYEERGWERMDDLHAYAKDLG